MTTDFASNPKPVHKPKFTILDSSVNVVSIQEISRERAAGGRDDPEAGGYRQAMSKHLDLEESSLYDRQVLRYIQRAAEQGLYDIRGLGAKRKVPHFDDLLCS